MIFDEYSPAEVAGPLSQKLLVARRVRTDLIWRRALVWKVGAVTRLHTMIGLTVHRTRNLLRIRRALFRLTEKAYFTYVALYHTCTNLRHYHGPPRNLPGPQPGSDNVERGGLRGP
jgi:hypothetical protein